METQTLQPAETTVVSSKTKMLRIDPTHSTIGFSIKHMVFATAHGRFSSFRGMIRFDDERPEAVEAHIDAATIDTGIEKRDEHLRSADFFDVATYPTISFHSTQVEPMSPLDRNHWHVVGDLTMHGVTRSIELAVKQSSAGQNPWGGRVRSFVARTKIRRADFGLSFNLPLDGGGLVIGDDVAIEIAVQALNDPIGGR